MSLSEEQKKNLQESVDAFNRTLGSTDPVDKFRPEPDSLDVPFYRTEKEGK